MKISIFLFAVVALHIHVDAQLLLLRHPAGMNYKLHAYTVPRSESSNLERDNSYSNAEFFSHAYKQLGIGKLVGQPTNDFVISTGGRQLIDGLFVRLPGRGWFKKLQAEPGAGPAVPDILVDNDPG